MATPASPARRIDRLQLSPPDIRKLHAVTRNNHVSE